MSKNKYRYAAEKPNPHRTGKVRNYLVQVGVTDHDVQKLIIVAFGKSVGEDRITRYACDHWKQFKQFVNEKIQAK